MIVIFNRKFIYDARDKYSSYYDRKGICSGVVIAYCIKKTLSRPFLVGWLRFFGQKSRNYVYYMHLKYLSRNRIGDHNIDGKVDDENVENGAFRTPFLHEYTADCRFSLTNIYPSPFIKDILKHRIDSIGCRRCVRPSDTTMVVSRTTFTFFLLVHFGQHTCDWLAFPDKVLT